MIELAATLVLFPVLQECKSFVYAAVTARVMLEEPYYLCNIFNCLLAVRSGSLILLG
jgi:hypothetical protein